VRIAQDDESFAAAPIGACIAGDGFVFARPDAELFVSIVHGRPTEAAIRRLVRLWAIEQAPRHLSLFEARGLVGVEPAAFDVLVEEMRTHRDELQRAVIRQAIVTPEGFPGAVVAGYRAVISIPFDVELFEDRGAALAWLGRADAAPAIADASALLEGDRTVAALRSALSEQLDLKVGEAARRLGMSERSLQRRLREAATSFQEEVQAARIHAAKRLLVDTDAKLTAIALEVSCGTLQSFSSLFRRATGMTPTEYRARHRR